jgi:D-glycero-D-manno-heptose 1,7-bisphosphate phosphatase
MHTAIFMDRDGVIIENRPHYVLTWSDVEFIPQSLEALRRIRPTIKVIIISNQSAVGRGLINLSEALALNRRIEEEIRNHGGRVDGSYLCPHSPQQACQCRKPRPGLILQAARELDLDLAHSIMIGDALSDILAGKNAGITKNILVETGRGSQQLLLPELRQIDDLLIYSNLLTALLDQPEFITA